MPTATSIPPPTTCDGCGVCCEEQGLPPGYLDPSLMTFLPDALRDEIAWHQQEEAEAGRTRHERGLPCIWLVAGRCAHYEYRPQPCRDAPIGGSSCTFWRLRRPLPPPARPARRRRRTKKSDGGDLS